MPKITIQEEIDSFLTDFGANELTAFFTDVMPLIDLYYVTDDQDWVKDAVGAANEKEVRIARTVYLASKIADFHSGKFAYLKMKYKGLWSRMEKDSLKQEL